MCTPTEVFVPQYPTAVFEHVASLNPAISSIKSLTTIPQSCLSDVFSSLTKQPVLASISAILLLPCIGRSRLIQMLARQEIRTGPLHLLQRQRSFIDGRCRRDSLSVFIFYCVLNVSFLHTTSRSEKDPANNPSCSREGWRKMKKRHQWWLIPSVCRLFWLDSVP